ncbi:prolyl oligopeptidase-like protein [Hyaloscypha finlandica]|nr:prolyl oligopeptidase-like protein [Hyaloscypha finlandica]
MPPRLISLSSFRTSTKLCNQCYSTAPRVRLAYDLHEPAKPSSNAPGAIIFMHGLFGSKKNNRSISKALARDLGRPIYAVDLRNHGDSAHNPHHDYISMADDVAGFIEEHKLKDTTLIGHSMGAKTAMTLALRSPEIINDIVSVDNAPLDAALLSNFGKYIQGMKKIEEAGVTRQAEADKILVDYEESLPIRQFLLGNLYRPADDKTQKFKVPLKILASALDNLGDFPYKDPSEVRFEKRALFARGIHSKYVPDEALPIIGQFFPRFELADIEAGHWVISENPEAFREAVVEFLKPKE